MFNINEKTLSTLEFTKIRQMLADKAISRLGKEEALKISPFTSLFEIEHAQKETSEALNMILKKGSLPLGGVKDVVSAVKRAEMFGVLSILELLDVCDCLYVAEKMKKYATQDTRGLETPTIAPLFECIEGVPKLERELSRCILNHTDIADDASQPLLEIRRGIKSSHERIKEHLTAIIHSPAYKQMLQDGIITIRSERYCVPVKQEYKNNFPGMVHDQSQSGATLFIEPLSVVQLNNKIKELFAREKEEIEKILKRLSENVAENAAVILLNSEMFTRLDFIFAKGELSLMMNATEPKFNTRGVVNIKKGRHPLLDKTSVVPTNIYIGETFTTLLITGPNTGGKTVSLKTLGLFTLMGQSGLNIPALDHSELAVFDQVFADIGDEQSIEQSLSTFSSHMTNIVDLIGKITNKSLVLLDELGAGTDPTEGAALAIAILQFLRAKGVRTAVTTHYSELKVFALSTEGVENASCEFDVVTLRPTYKLLIGVPGKSNAFAISGKIGLSDEIIDSAREILSHSNVKFEDVITDLEIRKKSVILEQERAESYRKEAERLKNELISQQEKLRIQKEKILVEAKTEAARIVQSAKENADDLIKQLKKELSAKDTVSAEKTRQSIREKLVAQEDSLQAHKKPQKPKGIRPKTLKKGDRVYIHSLNQSGTVVALPDQNGDTQISFGIMKMKVNSSDLSLDETEATVTMSRKHVSTSIKSSKSMNMSAQLDLRGLMVSEALEKVDKYVDDAYLSSLSQVSIIHGKGTGALRTAVQAHLKSHPLVSKYRLGEFGEGDGGVTIATLEK